MTRSRTFAVLAIAGAALAVAPGAASAQGIGGHRLVSKSTTKDGVRYGANARHGGYQALVSDGPGSGFGFNHNPIPYRVGAAIARDRQVDAVHRAVADSALDSQPHGYGFYGDSVYGHGNGAAYGVFNGADGYGSPYFAGYYGRGGGEDYGVFGHAYTN